MSWMLLTRKNALKFVNVLKKNWRTWHPVQWLSSDSLNIYGIFAKVSEVSTGIP